MFELFICKDESHNFIFIYYIAWHLVIPQFLFERLRRKSLLWKPKDWVNKGRDSAIMKENSKTLKIYFITNDKPIKINRPCCSNEVVKISLENSLVSLLSQCEHLSLSPSILSFSILILRNILWLFIFVNMGLRMVLQNLKHLRTDMEWKYPVATCMPWGIRLSTCKNGRFYKCKCWHKSQKSKHWALLGMSGDIVSHFPSSSWAAHLPSPPVF